MGMLHCLKVKCDHYFSIDSIVSLTNPNTLKILLAANKNFIAPMINEPDKFWKSNFWGDLTLEGKYIRSPDYWNITNNTVRGIWNVPYVRDVYLISAPVLERMRDENPFVSNEDFNQYFQFCSYMRDLGVFMYVTNTEHFGHLKTMASPQHATSRRHKTLYNLFSNKADWMSKYMHPDVDDVVTYLGHHTFEEPCQDVFMFPLVSTMFADHLIDDAEHQRLWLADSNIPGGYKNMASATLKSIELQTTWRFVLKEYLVPIVKQLFLPVDVDFDASIDFVTKQWHGMRRMPVFNDTSMFTVSVILNEAGPEYSGGGERFTRYGCTLQPSSKVGWATVRPGGFTHQFELLPVTDNTRYMLVSLMGVKQ